MKEGYLRVTNILYPFSGLEKVDKDLVAHAAERGTRVHKTCEGIVKGLGEFGVDDETWGYVESFKQWWADGLDKEVVDTERRFYCDIYGITGQADLIIKTPAGLAIVDYKTSSKPSKTWQAQAEAYYYLAKAEGLNIQHLWFLHLSKHGKSPKVHSFECDHTFFFHCYHVYQHFYQKKG